MAKKEKPVRICVEPDTKEASGYRFWMEEKEDDPIDVLIFNKSIDGYNADDEYLVRFKLKNKNGANLQFSMKEDKVLWAKKVKLLSEACPTSKCDMPGEFYLDTQNYPLDPDTLTVVNPDKNVFFFKFGMNFVPKGTVEGPGTNYILFDPIGSDQNGGYSRSFASAMTVGLLSGAVAGAAAMTLVAAATPASLLAAAAVGALMGAIVALIVGSLSGRLRPSRQTD